MTGFMVPSWCLAGCGRHRVRIRSHHPRSAVSQAGDDADCVCSDMHKMTDVGEPAAWAGKSVGLRMPRRTQAVKSVMTQWLSAAMPPATYALTYVTSRMPPVVLVSAVYLAGYVCLGMRTCPDM